MPVSRRDVLKLLGGGALAFAAPQSLAACSSRDEADSGLDGHAAIDEAAAAANPPRSPLSTDHCAELYASILPSVKEHGAVGDGSADDAAAFAGLAAGAYVVPAGNYRVGNTATVPVGVHLFFQDGAVLRPESATTLTLSGGLQAPPSRIFDLAPGGRITFADNAPIERLVPQWWGAEGNGSTDCTAAFQHCINAAKRTDARGRVVAIPSGQYRITSEVLITDTWGMRVEGSGWSTELNWAGTYAPDGALFRLRDVGYSHFADFRIGLTDRVGAVFLQENGGGGAVVPTQCMWERIFIEGQDGKCDYGWYNSGAGAGGDNNSEWHRWSDCRIHTWREAAWYVGHSQSKFNRMDNCVAYSFGHGKHVVQTLSGSFHWTGGGGGGANVSDFHLENAWDVIKIEGWDGEDSRMLLTTGGPSPAGFTVQLIGCSWRGGRVNHDGSNPDHYFIQFLFPGPLMILGGNFGEGSPKGIVPRIQISSNHRPQFVCEGVLFNASGSDQMNPFSMNEGSFSIKGNSFLRPDRSVADNVELDWNAAVPKVFRNVEAWHTWNDRPTIIANFEGFRGQKITIIGKVRDGETTPNTVFAHGPNIRLKQKADRMLAADESISLVNLWGVWHEA